MAVLARLALGVAGVAVHSTADAARAAPEQSPKEVRIGYFANLTHAQAVLGVAGGDFERAVAPARLTTRVFNAGPSLIEALFAGEIDIGYVGPGPALNAHLKSRGKGIRVIAGAAANGVVIVTGKHSGVRTIDELKGKRVATPQLGNTQDLSARHYLVKVLGQPNADTILPIANAEQVSMMARGQIDAAWAVEPWGARLVEEAGGTIIAEEKDLWPGKQFVLTLVVASPEFLARYPDTVRRFLEAHCDWTDRLAKDAAKHIPALGAAIEKLTGKKLSEKILSDATSRVRFTTDPGMDSLSAFAQWAFELGLARSIADKASLVDTTILARVRPAPAPATPAAPTGQKP